MQLKRKFKLIQPDEVSFLLIKHYPTLITAFYELQSSWMSRMYKKYQNIELANIVCCFVRNAHLEIIRQKEYNLKNNIIPTPLKTKIKEVFDKEDFENKNTQSKNIKNELIDLKKLSNEEKVKSINVYRKKMEAAAKSLDFIEAARLRDIIKELKK